MSVRFVLLKPTTLWWTEEIDGILHMRHQWIYTTEELMWWWENRRSWGFTKADGGWLSVGFDIEGTAAQNPDIIQRVEETGEIPL